MKIAAVAGARPNFVKIAPIVRALKGAGGGGVEVVLVDTGQHYDEAMAAAFLRDLQLPQPQHSLRVGSGSHAAQTAAVMRSFEPVITEERPDVVLVVGDVNSTLACALVAAKLGVPVAHVEAGLRSFDRSMPEEINRVLTDALADLLFTTESAANENLRREGVAEEKIHFVGNVMIDSLRWAQPLWERSPVLARLGVEAGSYALATLHRPGNVDDRGTLAGILGALAELSHELPVLLPAHPRTRARIASFALEEKLCRLDCGAAVGELPRGRVALLDPLGYIDFLRLLSVARVVLTDSGGVQEEATCLGVPCLSLRSNTERPVTLDLGTSVLVGNRPQRILDAARGSLRASPKPVVLPPLWDGRAAERIAAILLQRREA